MRLTVQQRVSRAEAGAMLALADEAAAADAVDPLPEQARLDLRHATGSSTSFLLWQGDALAGCALLRAAANGSRDGELMVRPAARHRGLGTAITRAVIGEGGPATLRLWAHGDLPAAARLAAGTGFHRGRELWLMETGLAADLAEPRPPDGVTIRPFADGDDDAAWLALNARAFARHPEQGQWSMADLAHRKAEPWFDPRGFLLAERDGRLVGFHWTKLHPGGVGEVFVLGVDPAAHGGGLGRALALAGLRYLGARDARRVILYVDADNAAATGLYRSLGFTHAGSDVMYERRPQATLRTPSTSSISSLVSR